MPKLSDSQLVILTAACERDDGCAFPVTSKLKGNAAGNVLKSLVSKGLLEEVKAARDDTVWRHDENQGSLTLHATPAAYAALGMGADGDVPAHEAPQAAARGTKPKKATTGRAKATKPRTGATMPASGKAKAERKPRTDTKQAKLIAMLQTKDGATVEEIAAAFGWQAHTVRGALYGALKKKLGLDIVSEKVEGRGRVYRIGN